MLVSITQDEGLLLRLQCGLYFMCSFFVYFCDDLRRCGFELRLIVQPEYPHDFFTF